MAWRFMKTLLLSAIALLSIFFVIRYSRTFKKPIGQFFKSSEDIDSALRSLRKLMKSERIKKVKQFLKKNPSLINKSDANGITPLHIATYYEDKDLVKFLLKKGAAPDLRTRDGFTPLHIAVYKGNFEIIDQLLNTKEVDANRATSEDGYTPLHIAIRFSRPRHILDELINARADINYQTKQGRTPLHLAVIRGDVDTIKFLLQKGARVNTFSLPSNYDVGGKTPLDDALENGCQEIISILKAYGAQSGNNH